MMWKRSRGNLPIVLISSTSIYNISMNEALLCVNARLRRNILFVCLRQMLEREIETTQTELLLLPKGTL